MKKVISYFKCFGFKETIKKVFRYIKFKIKTDSDGNYRFSKKEKQHVIFGTSLKDYDKTKFNNNISIVVLNYNNMNVIGKCLDSLIKYREKYNYEVVVVDNGSNDGSYEFIKRNYDKQIVFVKNTKNGCSSGRNLGVKNCNKDYIMFLDSDQFVLNKDWLDVYLKIFTTYPDIGAIGWAAGWFDKNGYSYHVVDNFEYRYMPKPGIARCEIGYLGSGGMFLKMSVFNKIGGFDINYDPTCYEDTDLSLKIRNINKEIYYCPFLGIEHKAHQTTKSGSENYKKLIEEKGNYFVDKWKKINKDLLKFIK